MYIEYITPQRVADPSYTEYDSKGGEYRPTWLIRTSDWQKVPGHEATDGYHTLSYVWKQSGEKFKRADGEFDLIDKGRHRIKVAVESRTASNFFRKHKTTKVRYEGVLQQICRDFNIEYLWYDKICTNQNDKEEKQREIKQMHLIYSNARYTVAVVPEVNIENPKDFERINQFAGYTKAKSEALRQMHQSRWFQRSWTLEEVMMSTRILIIGRNAHFWSLADIKQGGQIKEDDLLANSMLGFKERKIKSANQVLRFAHFRSSTKEHDKIFALINIFHGIIDIDLNYGSDVSTVMNIFYRHLATKDLSMMCFGSNLYLSKTPRRILVPTMHFYNLPSWTGVDGLHSSRPITDITLDQNCDYTIDDDMRLRIKCRSYAISPCKYKDDDVFVFLERKRGNEAQKNYHKAITSMDDFNGNESEALDWGQWCMSKVTDCIATHYYKPDNHGPFLSPLLPLSLTEKKCDSCVILGIVFHSVIPAGSDGDIALYDHHYLSPVAKKSTDGSSHSRIIGVILLKHFRSNEPLKSPQKYMDHMFNNLECETQEFCIK